MPTVDPSAAHERALLDRVVRELAGSGRVVEIGGVQDLAELGADDVAVCALDRVDAFLPVVERLVAVDATVVLSVPNDAFAGGDSAWGEGAIAELRGLLPRDHLAFHEVALRGAALVPADGAELTVPVEVAVGSVPVRFVLVFGPRAERLAATGAVGAADLSAERAFERERTAELEVLRARVAA